MMLKLPLFFATILALLLGSEQSQAQENCDVSGRVRERGTRNQMSAVNLFFLPSRTRITTDNDGGFGGSVPKDDQQVVLNVAGYNRLDLTGPFCDRKLELFVERTNYSDFETTVFGRQDRRDETTRSLKAKQAVEMPGSFGDPIRGMQNLPGVNRTSSAQVVIQGGEPEDTRYTIDDHPVPFIFHFGGFTSVIFPEAADRIDYLSAGYGVQFGRALSGYINANTKLPRSDRWGGVAFVDLINAGALFEGPIDSKRGLLLSGRYSYIGQVIKSFNEQNPDAMANFTAAPVFSDLQLTYSEKTNDRFDWRLTAISSRDGVELILKEPLENNPNIRGSFENETTFYRVMPSARFQLDARNQLQVSASAGEDKTRTSSEEIYFRIRTQTLSLRTEWKSEVDPQVTRYLGLDNTYTRALVQTNLSLPFSSGGVANPVSSGQRRQVDTNGRDANVSLYWREDWKFGNWLAQPQLRTDWLRSTKEFLLGPRAAIKHNINDDQFLRLASGLYYQAPLPQENNETYGNPDLKAQRAIHLALGYGHDFRGGGSRGLRMESGLFLKELDRLVAPSRDTVTRNGTTVFENFNNKGTGRSYGLEVMMNADYAPWSLYLAYTLSRSTRQNPVEGKVVAQFDQTHNLNFQATYQVEKWKFASRTRFVTGNPTTAIVGSVYDSDNDVYIPVRGATYGDRLGSFFQTDLRVDRKFVYDTWILSVYLDLQNLTNAQSPQGFLYSYDYSKKEPIAGLGLFPSLGVKGEF